MRKTIIFCILALLCAVPACAAELSIPGLDRVWEEAEGYGVSEDSSLDEGLSNLFDRALEQAGGLFRAGLATAARLAAVVLLCSLAQSVGESGEGGLQAVSIAGALSITALTMTDMAVMIGMGRDTLGKMEGFSGLLLPVMSVLTAATGGITGAAVRQGATVLFSQLLITAMDRLLIPLVYAYVAASCAYAAVGNPGLKRTAGLLKGTITFVLTALLLAFVGYLTASGAIAGSVDAAAVKAAKLAISRAIPVVGGILSEAAESVLAGAGLLRGMVGTVGVLALLGTCLAPFLHLGCQYLLYQGAALVASAAGPKKLTKLIAMLADALGLVLAMTAASALLLVISLVSAVTAVSP